MPVCVFLGLRFLFLAEEEMSGQLSSGSRTWDSLSSPLCGFKVFITSVNLGVVLSFCISTSFLRELQLHAHLTL